MQTSTRFYTPGKACINCDRVLPLDHFPLARPRADGSRHPMRYCEECLAEPFRLGGGADAHRYANRAYRFRNGSPPYPPSTRRDLRATDRGSQERVVCALSVPTLVKRSVS